MSAQNLESIAFPTLDAAQIREFERCTKAIPRSYRDGETLISVGDRDFKFFVVLSGEIEIVDHSGDEPRTVVGPPQGQFTGDVSHLTGRASVVSAVARGGCEVYEVSAERCGGASTSARPSATSSSRRSSPGGSCCASRRTSPGCG